MKPKVRNNEAPLGERNANVVTPDHYQTLRVVRGAEDAVIRGAYRALVRLYHPDTNPSQHAEEHLREINAAYAVLSDPIKRATYDSIGFRPNDMRVEDQADRRSPQPRGDAAFAFATNHAGIEEDPGTYADERVRLPMRNFGIASAAIAIGAILVVIVQPQAIQTPRPQQVRAPAPIAANIPAAPPAANLIPQAQSPAEMPSDPSPLPLQIDPDLAQVEAPALAAIVHQPRHRQPARTTQRAVPQVVAAEVAVPTQDAPARAMANAVASPPARGCRQGSGAGGQCADDRLAKVERIAKTFLSQSMGHADWSKQQLLLSARNRAVTSRNLCRSDSCVAEAYVRQIREISVIMEGRRPTP
jgi:hypothetical protein